MTTLPIRLNGVRASFLDIRSPYTPPSGDAKFKGNFIGLPDSTVTANPKTDKEKTYPFSEFQKLLDALRNEEWGNPNPPKLENYAYAKADGTNSARKPVTDVDGNYYDGYDADTCYIVASMKAEKSPEGPMIVDQLKQPMPAETGHPIAGDIVNANINLFSYVYNNQKGVSASLVAIQYVKAGEPFGAKPADASSFDEVEVEDEAKEATCF